MTLKVFSNGPYYDDYDESKGFYRILFKPGVSVQARELTQLQTMLQKQIERHGSSIFKEGSIVTGGKTTSDSTVSFLRISSTLLNSVTISTLVGQTLNGVTSGSSAKVISYFQETLYPNSYTLIVRKYSDKSFTQGETLTYQPNPPVAGVNEATLLNLPYVFQGNCTSFSVQEGVYYTNGNFVYCAPQIITIAMDVYDGSGNVIVDGTQANARVGLRVLESVVDADSDSSLLDPSLGSYNYNAPGADRYYIDLVLVAKPLLKQCVATVGVDGTGALTTFTIVHPGSGYPTVNFNSVPITITDPAGTGGTAIIGGVDQYTGAVTAITRTSSGSGYSGNSVQVTVALPTEADDTFIELSRYDKGTLVKNVNHPIYSELGDTMARRTYDESGDYALNKFGVHMSDSELGSDYFSANVDPGKAYVKGYETNFIATTVVDILRARDSTHQISVSGYNINTYYGNWVLVLPTDVAKPFDPTTFPLLKLMSSSVQIGTARLVSITYDTSGGYRFHLSQVNITNITKSFFNVDQLQLNSDATTTANIQIANRLLNETSISSLFHVLPNAYTKTVNGSLNYNYWVVKTGTVSAIGGLTITQTGNVQFKPVSSALSDISSAYIVFNQTSGGIVNMTGVTVTASGTNPTTAVFTGLPANANVTILALVEATGITKKDKTLNNGLSSGSHTYSYVLTTTDINNGYVTLDNWDGVKLISVTVGADDVTSRFTFDSGERDESYQYARIILYPHELWPVAGSTLNITYDYLFHSATGDFFCVDSYPSYDDIPIYTAKDGTVIPLENVLDFRPNADSTNPPVLPYISDDMVVSYTYYIGRRDLLVIDKSGIIKTITGIPNLNPKYPPSDPNSMTIGTLDIAPYTADPTFDVVYKPTDNRVYTMHDIGILDKRISHLEYYNALTLLEKASTDLLVLDSSGNNRFKNGTLVDSFSGHSVSDVGNPDMYCGIDILHNYMTAAQVVAATTTKPITDTENNVVVTNDLVTLKYSVIPFLVQGEATDDISVNPFDVTIFNGVLVTDPPSDHWKDVASAVVVNNDNGSNNHFLAQRSSIPPNATVRHQTSAIMVGIQPPVSRTDSEADNLSVVMGIWADDDTAYGGGTQPFVLRPKDQPGSTLIDYNNDEGYNIDFNIFQALPVKPSAASIGTAIATAMTANHAATMTDGVITTTQPEAATPPSGIGGGLPVSTTRKVQV